MGVAYLGELHLEGGVTTIGTRMQHIRTLLLDVVLKTSKPVSPKGEGLGNKSRLREGLVITLLLVT